MAGSPLKANVVVLTKGTDLDLFARFYSSLLASDFPKDHVLTVIPPFYSLHEGRALGVEIASKTAEFVLLADCDIIVPPIWWSKVFPAFEDPKVGVCGTMVKFCHPDRAPFTCSCLERQEITKYHLDDMLTSEKEFVENLPATLPQTNEMWGGFYWDGFMVIRAAAFRAENGKVNNFVIRKPESDYKIVVATRVAVGHNKNVKDTSVPSVPTPEWINDYLTMQRTDLQKERGVERGRRYLKVFLDG